jgi:cyclophilin family peptidyl-prolyl cis-trans isomerase
VHWLCATRRWFVTARTRTIDFFRENPQTMRSDLLPLCRNWLFVLALFVATTALAQAPAMAPAAAQVRFVTSLGAFTIELDGVRAPLSTLNFLQYVHEGHYDGTIFHRVIGNFMVQGGGFGVDGKEKPVRSGVPNESGNGLSNRRGTVAMARTDDPHSGNSQFFVNLVDNHALDPSPSRWGYAVFGRVVDGMETIDKIASVATGEFGPFTEDAPLQPVSIESARVVGEPAAAK